MRSSLGGHFAGHGMYYTQSYDDYVSIPMKIIDYKAILDKEMEQYQELCGPVKTYRLSPDELKKYKK